MYPLPVLFHRILLATDFSVPLGKDLGEVAHTNTAVALPHTQLETKQLVSWRLPAVSSEIRHLGF